MNKLGVWMAAMAMAAGVAWAQPVRTTATPPAPSARPAASVAKDAPDKILDLNKATAEEFEALPGIGPARAKAMVDYQKQHGYKRVADLTKIQGIGRKTLAKLRPSLTVTPRVAATRSP